MTAAPRFYLKCASGWFAAGAEVEAAVQLLSDAAFKLFVWLCLHAERTRGCIAATPVELGRALQSLGFNAVARLHYFQPQSNLNVWVWQDRRFNAVARLHYFQREGSDDDTGTDLTVSMR